MKSQKVKNVSYLCKAEFPLHDTESRELVILPAGAEVISVNLEIPKAVAGGAVSIGLDSESDTFLNGSSTAKAAFFQSAKLLTTPKQSVVTAKVTGCNQSSESAVVRVLYYLPSEILVEY